MHRIVYASEVRYKDNQQSGESEANLVLAQLTELLAWWDTPQHVWGVPCEVPS